MSDAFTSTSVNQSGKSGGDTSGFATAGSSALSGGGFAGTGVLSDKAAGSMSLSASADGGYSNSGASAMAGGDVTDNTSIGNININS